MTPDPGISDGRSPSGPLSSDRSEEGAGRENGVVRRRRPSAIAGAAALLLATALLGSCGGDGGGEGGPTADGPSGDTVRAQRVARIGRIDGPPEVTFGDVTSVAADAEGRIYVADRIGSTIRAYTPDGAFLATVGAEGGGPGEFDGPRDLVFDGRARLWVRDGRRVTVLAPSASGLADSAVATRAIPGYPNTSSRRSRVAADESLYLYPAYRYPRDGSARYFYLVLGPDGAIGDTVPVPRYHGLERTRTAFVRTSPSGGRMVEGLTHAPFEPVPAWDVTRAGEVVGGDGASSRLLRTGPGGGTLGRIELPSPGRRPVPEGLREDSAAAMAARIDSLPVALDRLRRASEAVRTGEPADSLPAFTDVHVGAAGRIWVRRWPAGREGEATVFDVLGAGGEHVGTVLVPAPLAADPPPWVEAGRPGRVVGVVRDPVTGVDRVEAYRVELPR